MGKQEVRFVGLAESIGAPGSVPLEEGIVGRRDAIQGEGERQISAGSGEKVEHTEELTQVVVEGKFCNETSSTTGKDPHGGHRHRAADFNHMIKDVADDLHVGQPEPVAS